MLIVGERINTSRHTIAEAATALDTAFIVKEARDQLEAGADFLDVNAGTFAEKERQSLMWIINTIRASVDAPLCLDSTDPGVIEEALSVCGKKTMVNSITAEKKGYSAVLPLVRRYDCRIVALGINDEGIPAGLEKKLKVSFGLVDNLLSDGVKADNIYVDPLIMAISTDHTSGRLALSFIEATRKKYPEIHIICGLSNTSFGMPLRKALNRAFLSMAMTVGLDAVIMDPLDKQTLTTLIATNTLLGNDESCRNYIAAYRNKRLSL